jgi:hypothetical protein
MKYSIVIAIINFLIVTGLLVNIISPITNKSGIFLNIEVFINKLKYYVKNYKINRTRFNKIS